MCIDNIEFSTNSDRILKKDINILIYIIIKCLFSQCIFEGNVEKKLSPLFMWISVDNSGKAHFGYHNATRSLEYRKKMCIILYTVKKRKNKREFLGDV